MPGTYTEGGDWDYITNYAGLMPLLVDHALSGKEITLSGKEGDLLVLTPERANEKCRQYAAEQVERIQEAGELGEPPYKPMYEDDWAEFCLPAYRNMMDLITAILAELRKEDK